MKALLIGEQTIQVFVVNDGNQDYFVTWNKENHTENLPNASVYIPEYVVEDDEEEEVVQGCQVWLDAVEAVKQWHAKYHLYEADQE